MKEKALIKRYAEAYLAYMKEAGNIDVAISEIKNVKSILRENADLKSFFLSKKINYSQKCEFIDLVFKDSLLPKTRNFLKFLIDKNRIQYLADIADYVRVNYGRGNVKEAIVKTSFPMDTDFLVRIKKGLEDKFNTKLHLYIELDSTLLGGIKVIIGNRIIDGSVKKRLDDLRTRLLKVRVN